MEPRPTLVLVELHNAMPLHTFTPHLDALPSKHVVNAYRIDDSRYVLQLPDSVPAQHQGTVGHATGAEQSAAPAQGAPAQQPAPPNPVVQTVSDGLGGIAMVSHIHWCH
jgi:hypothetical protein